MVVNRMGKKSIKGNMGRRVYGLCLHRLSLRLWQAGVCLHAEGGGLVVPVISLVAGW